ncbi:unnamed protein product [Caenorhabditis auriculariae]|uniref:Uncharacterized protein n=1 Tax=Caenorhabditis auriculariae TaxID=2777116 RepID=A0A8S1GZ98_9PELO|nr:unnamed protein product [Caenorhabditis auriculariae]
MQKKNTTECSKNPGPIIRNLNEARAAERNVCATDKTITCGPTRGLSALFVDEPPRVSCVCTRCYVADALYLVMLQVLLTWFPNSGSTSF